MEKKLLALEGLSKYYTGAQFVVMGLNHITVSFDRGEFVAITGESGSGKSTLAHVLGGILPYESGELYFDGKPTSHFDGSDYERYRRDNISFISQNYGILPGCSVLENVVSALRLAGMEKRDARSKAREILKEVELWDLKNRRAAKLSSGQKQRLSIARALAKPAPILIADEPTGNLDPENSAKVIQLLAHAAKERLVILITHEFQEAADYVTRHVVIQDGRIAMDTQLRPAAAVAEAPRKQQKKGKVLSPYIARLQLGGRPVWSTLVLAFFALTAFAVFAFLGTFIVNLDDTSTRVYDNSSFFNGDMERIVVGKGDGSYFTEEDYAALTAVDYVVSLERYGYVTDISYAYREGVDYDVSNKIDTDADGNNAMLSTVTVRKTAPFIQTVPVLPEGQEFLTAGRLPENIYEVVMAGGPEKLGTTLTVYLHDHQLWGENTLTVLEVTVVGVTDMGEGLYLHTDIGRGFTYTTLAETYNPGNRGYMGYFLLPNSELEKDQCIPSQERYSGLSYMLEIDGEMVQVQGSVSTLDLRLDREKLEKISTTVSWDSSYYVVLELVAEEGVRCYHDSPNDRMLEISRELFDELTPAGSDQISIFIEDYAYTDRVLAAVQELGYAAISPFQLGSTKQNTALAEERMQTLMICVLALLAVVVLQVIVLRALFAAQTESYRTLSNMGLTCGMAKRSVLWQVLLFTVLGQAVGFGAIQICAQQGVERIAALTKYLPADQFAVLCAVHLAASAVAAMWIIRTLTRQVFPLAGKESDMDFEEGEVGA